MVARSEFISARNEIEALGVAWTRFGRDFSFDLSLNHGLCVIERCNGMSFVALRTQAGPRPVCLKHFDEVEDSLRPPRVA